MLTLMQLIREVKIPIVVRPGVRQKKKMKHTVDVASKVAVENPCRTTEGEMIDSLIVLFQSITGNSSKRSITLSTTDKVFMKYVILCVLLYHMSIYIRHYFMFIIYSSICAHKNNVHGYTIAFENCIDK